MIMKITLLRSPKKDKKFRVILPSGKKVDFGQLGYSDFTIHKNPMRMRSYVQRHGGNVPKRTMDETNPSEVKRCMLRVTKSDKENWRRDGIDTAGFWSRWLLWSHPTISGATKIIEEKFGVDIKRK